LVVMREYQPRGVDGRPIGPLRQCPMCFMGVDAVSWLMNEKHIPHRETAVRVMEKLFKAKAFRHVSDTLPFLDKLEVYTFYMRQPSAIDDPNALLDGASDSTSTATTGSVAATPATSTPEATPSLPDQPSTDAATTTAVTPGAPAATATATAAATTTTT